jgi:hypothetical protein
MDQATRKLTIATLKDRVELLKIACDAYYRDFKGETLTSSQRSEVAHKWDTALKEWRSLRSTLAQLQDAERAEQSYFGS